MDLKGIYHNSAVNSATFSGWQGIKAFAGNPTPSIQIVADRTAAYTTESVELTAYQTYANYLEWQHSRDEITWVAVGDSAPTHGMTFTHTADEPGTHYFRCIALNLQGETPSNTITIEVRPRAPSITISTDAPTLITPGTITLSADAAYMTILQWQISETGDTWENLSGETDLVLIRTYDLEDTGTHYFRCIAYGLNSASTTSNQIVITTAAPAPTITVSASAAELPAPATVTLTAETNHSTILQWQHTCNNAEWADVSGETTPEMTFSTDEPGTHYFRCIASGIGGETISSPVSVHIKPPAPTITIFTSADELLAPATATLTATATRATLLQWQTYSDNTTWVNIDAAEEDTLELTYLPEDAGVHQYRCLAMNEEYIVISNVIEISITSPPPTITITAPETTILAPNYTILTADSEFASSWQWQEYMEGEWIDITDATDPTLIRIYQPADAGTHQYLCHASGISGEVDSNIITIIVTAPEIPENEHPGTSM